MVSLQLNYIYSAEIPTGTMKVYESVNPCFTLSWSGIKNWTKMLATYEMSHIICFYSNQNNMFARVSMLYLIVKT